MLISLRNIYFDAILKREKLYEGRLRRGPFARIKVNDFIQFKSQETGKIINTQVTSLHNYQTFKQMLKHLGYKNLIPHATSLDQAVEIYRSFPGFRENEKIATVLAIGIKIIDNSISIKSM